MAETHAPVTTVSPSPSPAGTRHRGRFAPSPTGPLHLGSLVAAVGSWLFARHRGGDWLLRIEDIDPPREQAGAARQQLATLAAFGLVPDAPVLWQSSRGDAYAAALECLLASDRAFTCACSRSELAAYGGIHRSCVAASAAPACAERPLAIRLRVDAGVVGFVDAIQGRVEQDVAREVGDFVLRRADGWWAYQLAVVVDDAAQGITEVVRGADLLASTPRQILLQRALGLPTPAYAHLPLVLDAQGRKLSKADAARPVDPGDPLPALRHALAWLGQDVRATAGAANAQTALQRALAVFDPGRIPSGGVPAAVGDNG